MSAAVAVARRTRPRLAHVDAMRPLKQAIVITTHSLIFFAPAAGVAVGATELVTHVGRFAFMFISAAMLVYAYPDLTLGGLGAFWRRRLLAVALPYALWTSVYFLLESIPNAGVPGVFRPTGGITGSWAVTLHNFVYTLATGYYQLYFLILLLEFYLVYPAFVWLLRRTARHHWLLAGASLVVQLALDALIHWGVHPGWMAGFWGMRLLWNYEAYLVVGGIMALHYDQVHTWLCRHWRLALGATVGSVAMAESWFVLGDLGIINALAGQHDSSGAYQPILLPTFLALIATIYLAGVALGPSPRAGPGARFGLVGRRQFIRHLPEPGPVHNRPGWSRVGEIGRLIAVAAGRSRRCVSCLLRRRRPHSAARPPTGCEGHRRVRPAPLAPRSTFTPGLPGRPFQTSRCLAVKGALPKKRGQAALEAAGTGGPHGDGR